MQAKISTDKKILVITDQYDKNTNPGRMIDRFVASYSKPPEVVDLRGINIKGACLGCMKCGYDNQCQYKDGFQDFYNNQVRKQIAYIISGPVSQNSNLLQILEGNVTARQSANLVDIVSDEPASSEIIDSILQRLAEQSVSYAEKDFIRPQNFLKAGGHKIFRDEIFGHIRSVWQADHRYYKKHGLYDFEQKKRGLRIMNFFILTACRVPSFRKKYYGNIMKFPSKRFGKVTDQLIQQRDLTLN